MKKYLYKGLFVALTLSLMIGAATVFKTPKLEALGTTGTSATAENENVVMEKTATDNKDGTYRIALDAYITGSVHTETVSQPLDVVMIMDQSGSMKEKYNGSSTVTVNEALKTAATNFISAVKQNSVDNNDVSHRIGLVKFASNGEQLALGSQYGANDYDGAAAFRGLMKDVSNPTAYNDLFRYGIDKLIPVNGETYPSTGFDLAKKLFVNNPSTDAQRQKVVIFFTDGIPSSTSSNSDWTNTNKEDNKTIALAKQLKAEGAKVYSVVATSDYFNNDQTLILTGFDYNKFLSLTSSNYPDANSMGDYLGQTFAPTGYYHSANNAAELDKIFESILNDVLVPSINLDHSTELKDFMSEHFEAPNPTDIKVYEEKYIDDVYGKRVFGNRKEITNDPNINIVVTGNQIDVTGFDYSANVVTKKADGTRFGSRIVVEFNTSKVSGFIGGKDVPTNTSEAGIYTGGAAVKNFPVPKVDVPIEFDFDANNNSLYIGSTPSDMSKMFDTDLNTPGLQFKDDKGVVHTLDGENNKFVDITYTVTDKNGNLIASYLIPAGTTEVVIQKDEQLGKLFENTDIKITANITYKGDTPTSGKFVGKQGTIYVFTPTLQVEDNVVFYGEKVNLNDQVKTLTWGNAAGNVALPTDEAPKLTYSYKTSGNEAIADPSKYEPSKTQGYIMSVANDDVDITQYTKIQNAVAHEGYNFEIQVVKGELVIEKQIDKQYTPLTSVNAEQSFKFKIDYKDEDGNTKTYFQTIQFSANEGDTVKQITLKGLRKGTYNISEVTDWSWRYSEVSNKRFDNYNGNGTTAATSENKSIVVGDRSAYSAGTKMFYGSETGTVIGGNDHAFAAKVHFENVRNNTNVVGDVATAINMFTNK